MAMRNDEFNKKIIENVKNRIVVSNLESEEHMKISKKPFKRCPRCDNKCIQNGKFCGDTMQPADCFRVFELIEFY